MERAVAWETDTLATSVGRFRFSRQNPYHSYAPWREPLQRSGPDVLGQIGTPGVMGALVLACPGHLRRLCKAVASKMWMPTTSGDKRGHDAETIIRHDPIRSRDTSTQYRSLDTRGGASPLPIVLHDGERVRVRGRCPPGLSGGTPVLLLPRETRPRRRGAALPLTLTLSPRREERRGERGRAHLRLKRIV